MRYIINGVIRSLSKDNITFELNKILIGKKFLLNGESNVIEEISIHNSSLFFHLEKNLEVIHKVKTIELDTHNKLIKVFSPTHHFFISFK
jgi:hypothetical protein